MIRVVLPAHLRQLAHCAGEITLEAEPTQRGVIDALEQQYPALRGTLRDPGTDRRRAFVRFYACEEDLSHESPDAALPAAVIDGTEPFLVIGAMAGGYPLYRVRHDRDMIRLPGFVARDHVVTVPLDHRAPGGATIDVFARELVDPDKQHDDLPYLLFLQGGPGGSSPRPLDRSAWIDVALRTHRVVLLDQRGTGCSTPITPAITRDRSAQEVADYLSLFRADAIVADAEILRRALIGDRRWDTLGQSYGGFVTLTYLSQAPEGLDHCYVTGGVPGLTATAEDVYARTLPRAANRSREFYARYPADEGKIATLVEHLDEHEIRLPDGDVLTPHRLRTIGSIFGMSYGFETIHWLLDGAWAGEELHPRFLYEVQDRTGFVDNVLYPLQEYTYGVGAATGWAAQREYDRRPEFAADARPVLLTAETMFPWMFREIRSLRPFGPAAELLAAKDDWAPLYDPDRLAGNDVPLCAAVYFDDLYVDAELQLQTIDQVGNARAWVTNEYEHDGLRSAPAVLERLFDIGAGRC